MEKITSEKFMKLRWKLDFFTLSWMSKLEKNTLSLYVYWKEKPKEFAMLSEKNVY